MKESLYIDLLKNMLTDYHRLEFGEYKPIYRGNNPSLKYRLLLLCNKLMKRRGYYMCTKERSTHEHRLEGTDWPTYAETMIGIKRLNNIEECFKEIMKDNIPGDFIETGVWRGGATIFMNALLNVYNIEDRIIWVADSFEGLPKPNEDKYSADKGDLYHKKKELAISLEQVKRNFGKYNLLDDNVKFLKGWFKDTLPTAPIKSLALLRLDGDMYESTMDGLVNLYPKLSKGGFIIIDDWGAVEACKQAVNDYRKANNITEEIKTIDKLSVFWRKEN